MKRKRKRIPRKRWNSLCSLFLNYYLSAHALPSTPKGVEQHPRYEDYISRAGNDLFMSGDGLSTDKLLSRFPFGERFVFTFFVSMPPLLRRHLWRDIALTCCVPHDPERRHSLHYYVFQSINGWALVSLASMRFSQFTALPLFQEIPKVFCGERERAYLNFKTSMLKPSFTISGISKFIFSFKL